MKKVFAQTGLALLCCAAVSAFAYDLTLNNADSNMTLRVNNVACELGGAGEPALVSVNVVDNGTSKTVSINTSGDVGFTCGGGDIGAPVSSSSSSVSSTPVSSSSSSAGGTPPAPGVDLSACGDLWPTNIVQGAELSLNGTPRAEQVLTGNNTVSYPVKTLNAGKNSLLSISGTSTTLRVNREVWVSSCPGAAALVGAGSCSASGTESTSLNIVQGSGPFYTCRLESNKQYFINVKNTSCASGATSCNFTRTIN